MKDPVPQSARAAAEQLADELPVGIRAEVEAALHERDQSSTSHYFDPISLGALIVSAAQLAWTIHRDRQERANEPAVATVTREVRLKLDIPDDLQPAMRDRIVSVVVAETMAAVEEPS